MSSTKHLESLDQRAMNHSDRPSTTVAQPEAVTLAPATIAPATIAPATIAPATIAPATIASATGADRALEPIQIEGIQAPVIIRYFETLNAGDFAATGQLFAAEGILQPPFDSLLMGPAAITAYLDQEARGFCLQPKHGVETAVAPDCTEFEIVGMVQTPWFSVNVCWQFILSPDQEILMVRVKLLASMQELLHLRR